MVEYLLLLNHSLFRNNRFTLNEMLQRNALKFATSVFYVVRNMKFEAFRWKISWAEDCNYFLEIYLYISKF